MEFAKTHRLISASIAFLALAATSCTYGDDDVVIISPAGLLTTQWSIGGTIAPSSCFVVGASDFELVLYDDDELFYGEIQAPCGDFGLTVELPVGFYSADATLVDPSDFAVSLTQVLDDLLVLETSELVVTVDFSADVLLTAQNEQPAVTSH